MDRNQIKLLAPCLVLILTGILVAAIGISDQRWVLLLPAGFFLLYGVCRLLFLKKMLRDFFAEGFPTDAEAEIMEEIGEETDEEGNEKPRGS